MGIGFDTSSATLQKLFLLYEMNTHCSGLATLCSHSFKPYMLDVALLVIVPSS